MRQENWRSPERGSSPTVREGRTVRITPSLTVGLLPRLSSLTKKISVDDCALLSYHPRNTGKEVIQKYMSSNHSEVAET